MTKRTKLWVDPFFFSDQGVNDRAALARFLRTEEQPVLFVMNSYS